MADNAKSHIYKLNSACLSEIMSYLPLKDVMTLELTSSLFEEDARHYYKCMSKWDIGIWDCHDVVQFHSFPISLWRKVGVHAIDVRFLHFHHFVHGNLQRMIDCFPNMKRLHMSCHSCDKMPIFPNGLEELSLFYISIDERNDMCFDKILSTLTKLVVEVSDPALVLMPWHRLRNVKEARFVYGSHELQLNRFNSQHSLESLVLVNLSMITDKCLRSLDGLPKVTALAIRSGAMNISNFSNRFCTKIKRLHISCPKYDLNNEYLNPFTQLECLTLDMIDPQYALRLIETVPTLQKIQTTTHMTGDFRARLPHVIFRLKSFLHKQQRTFTWCLLKFKPFNDLLPLSDQYLRVQIKDPIRTVETHYD